MPMLEDETWWEVWSKSKTTNTWILLKRCPTYKNAKEYFDTGKLFKDYEKRIVRAETHRSVVLEDLRGNLDD